jgi:predicted MFS family arabinose efflux permease
LFLLSGNMLLDALEVSTAVVGMPSIGTGLHLRPSTASLTMTAFALGFGCSILLAGRLVARFGRRRLYVLALLVFTVASIASGLAVDAPMLVATRFVKGVCVALTVPTGLAIIANTFAEGPARTRALSVYTLCGASGFSVGLALSGALTSISWRWSLLFSGAVAAALLVPAMRLVPGDAEQTGSPLGIRLRPGGLVSAALLRSAMGAAVMNGTYWSFLLVSTFELQSRLGVSPFVAGLVLLPSSIPLMLTALYWGRVVQRVGSGPLIVAGSLSAFLGYAWSLRQGAPVHLSSLLPTTLLVGIGYMLSFSAFHSQAISGVPAQRQGVVSGLYQTSVQLGGVIMLALVAFATGPHHASALLLVTTVAAVGVLVAVAGIVFHGPRVREGESWLPTPSKQSSS